MAGATPPPRPSPRPPPGRVRLEAILWLAAARALLWLRPFGRVRRTLTVLSRRLPGPAPGRTGPEGIGTAVRAAAQLVPHASCLPQALAAVALLERAGRPARLFLAGSLEGRLGFHGHAWVESDGRVVVGDGPGRHTVLGVVEAVHVSPAGTG